MLRANYRAVERVLTIKKMPMENKPNNPENRNGNHTNQRGFASMPKEKVEEIASKGGHASSEKAGHEGMAERGRAGGHASAEKAGHEGMAERGRAGGHASAEKAGHEGMAERGRAGGHASAEKAGHEGMAERGRAGGHASGSSKRSHEEEQEREK